MATAVALIEADGEEMRAFADELGWLPQPGGWRWRVPGMDAILEWRPVDDDFGALVIEGEDAELLRDDIAAGYELLDDVDVMNEIASVSSPQDLAPWARRLGVFAGGPFQSTTLSVMQGLMASPREEFATSVLAGLEGAAWPELVPSQRDIAQRRPQLKPACDRLVGDIERKSPNRRS